MMKYILMIAGVFFMGVAAVASDTASTSSVLFFLVMGLILFVKGAENT